MKKRARSEKSRYKHQTTGGHCTCAQYIAETMCLRMAENKNQGSLPFKFWNHPSWVKPFKLQLMAAQVALKEFSEAAIIKALQSTELYGIYSLRHPKVPQIFKKYQLLEDAIEAKPPQDLKVHEKATVRKSSYGKKSTFNRLREIDGEETNEEE